jgi:hypothetical protein
MKTLSALLSIPLLIALAAPSANAQCNATSTFSASKTIYLDSSGKEVRSVDEPSVIELTPTDITITPGDDDVMKGKVTVVECKWTVPYKEGKSVIKSSVSNGSGQAHDITIAIEGKGGIVTFIATIDAEPNKKIKLVGDKFAAK